ncbi:MAG: hypothetical protein OEV59_02270 [Deltaproteobacteria bacterium]|nr:hypothetical protein [Deltaproteobacteria bacterium]
MDTSTKGGVSGVGVGENKERQNAVAKIFTTIIFSIVICADILLAAAGLSYYFFISPMITSDVLRLTFLILFLVSYALGGAFLGLVYAVALVVERALTGAENIVHKVVGMATAAIIARIPRAAGMAMSIEEFTRVVDEQIVAMKANAEGVTGSASFVGAFIVRQVLRAVRFVYLGEFLGRVKTAGGIVTANNLDAFAREKMMTLVTDQVRAYTESIKYLVYAALVFMAALPFVAAYFAK